MLSKMTEGTSRKWGQEEEFQERICKECTACTVKRVSVVLDSTVLLYLKLACLAQTVQSWSKALSPDSSEGDKKKLLRCSWGSLA